MLLVSPIGLNFKVAFFFLSFNTIWQTVLYTELAIIFKKNIYP